MSPEIGRACGFLFAPVLHGGFVGNQTFGSEVVLDRGSTVGGKAEIILFGAAVIGECFDVDLVIGGLEQCRRYLVQGLSGLGRKIGLSRFKKNGRSGSRGLGSEECVRQKERSEKKVF